MRVEMCSFVLIKMKEKSLQIQICQLLWENNANNTMKNGSEMGYEEKWSLMPLVARL